MTTLLIVLALLCGVIETGLYLRGALRGDFKPNTITWLTWGTLISITFAAQLHEHAGPAAWLNAFYAAIYYAIALYGLRFWRYNVVPVDFIALGGAALAIALWLVTNNPLWSVLLVAVIDLCGLYPTFRKSWNQPFDEILTSYVLGCVKYALLMVALDVHNIITMLHPLTIVIVDSAFILTTLYRRWYLKKREIIQS